jgi:hypothetical protein
VNKLFFFLLLSLCVSFSRQPVRTATPTPPPTHAQPGDTLIILDASGSMNEPGEAEMRYYSGEGHQVLAAARSRSP